VLGLLREIQANDGLAVAEKRALGAEIDAIERHFFGEAAVDTPDLRQIAETWASRAR